MTAPVVIVGVNSWVSVAQADDYFAAKYGAAAWAALSLSERTQLLLTAARWIVQQNAFSIPWSSTADLVRQAQCEAAWFTYRWFDEYEKRRALSASGVTSFKVMDFSETLEGVSFPVFIADMLSDFSVANESMFPRVSRDVADNGSV